MTTPSNETPVPAAPSDFVRDIVAADNTSGKHGGRVVTRFPPEPNGYLHIGHAKSICLNFGIAGENPGGICHLRFDDTNPAREDVEYVDSIQEDVRWLGFDCRRKNKFYASDYFGKLYDFAVELIKLGKAYVCDLTPDEMIQYRGAPTVPGKESPALFAIAVSRRTLDLFARMRRRPVNFPTAPKPCAQKLTWPRPTSTCATWRSPASAKGGPSSAPAASGAFIRCSDYARMYLSDSIEGITCIPFAHWSFEVHRPLYDWILDVLKTPCHPQQIEFARLNLSYTVMSKRKLLQLVEENLVTGWDDPRMPTVAGLRRRGVTPEAIRSFCARHRRDEIQWPHGHPRCSNTPCAMI